MTLPSPGVGLLLGLGGLFPKLLELLEGRLLPRKVLEVALDLLGGVLGGDPLELVDLALADPDPLAAEIPAEGKAVDPVGVCDPLGRSRLDGGGGNSNPLLSSPKAI